MSFPELARTFAVKSKSNQSKWLIDYIRKIAERNFWLDRKVFGISAESVEASIARKVIEGVIASPGQILSAAEMPKEKFLDKGPVNEYAGKVMVAGSQTSSLQEAKLDDIRGVEVVVSPGLGGGESMERLHDTMSEMAKIFPNRRMAIYSPVNEGERRSYRYALGMGCYVVPDFINEEESENFFNKVFRRRFFDDWGRPLPLEKCQRVVLSNFSIGGREAESHFHFFASKLLEGGLPRRDIPKYFEKIAIFNVACPRPDWENPEVRPLTATVFSQDDLGCRKLPQFLMDFVIPNRGEKRVSMISRLGFDGDVDDKEMLLLLRHGEIDCGGVRGLDKKFVPNALGHNLSGYVLAILRLRESDKGMGDTLDLFDAFANRGEVDQEVKIRRASVFRSALPYERRSGVSEQEVIEHILSLQKYAQRESLARVDSMGFSGFLGARSSPPPSACSAELPHMVVSQEEEGSSLQSPATKKDRGNGGRRGFSTFSKSKDMPEEESSAMLEDDSLEPQEIELEFSDEEFGVDESEPKSLSPGSTPSDADADSLKSKTRKKTGR